MQTSVSLEGAVCSMPKKAEQPRELGKYIIANPRICHGEPTFKGTRKLVRDCIEMAAKGLTIDELASRANLPREAIVQALRFAAPLSRSLRCYFSCPRTSERVSMSRHVLDELFDESVTNN